jgi:hypothetical protein
VHLASADQWKEAEYDWFFRHGHRQTGACTGHAAGPGWRGRGDRARSRLRSAGRADDAPEATQGYDAGKRTKGRKQRIATDTLGLLLAVVITAASAQDTNGGKDVASQLAARHPTVTAGWADSGYKAGFLARAADAGIIFAIVPKEPGQKSFAPLPAGGS